MKFVIPAQAVFQEKYVPHMHRKRYKTFIGRIARGFDFLGYWFSPGGLQVANKTVGRMLEKVSRLYEQGASVDRIGEYVRRWVSWVCGGVNGFGAVVGWRFRVGIIVLVSLVIFSSPTIFFVSVN